MYYKQRNLDNIALLATNTRTAALKWHDFCVANNINVLIYETIRSEEKQREYVNSGASKTMQSYHLVGQALDFVPVNSKGTALWNGYGAAGVKKVIAEAKRLGFVWGGDWKGFVDKPHLQFNYKGYGTDPMTNVKMPVTKTNSVEQFQAWLNSNYKAGIKQDGISGPKTKAAALKALQTELNKQYNARLVVDGKWGPKTKAAVQSVRMGAKGNIVKILQGLLHCNGYKPGAIDGIFGKVTADSVLAFQKANKLTQDAIAGKATFEKLVK